MTTEREMLEFAANACGYDVEAYCNDGAIVVHNDARPYGFDWNPKDNSADCAAMCAKLDINTFWWSHTKEVECVGFLEDANHTEKHDGTDAGKESIWRYAATKVAAKIGGMK